MRLCAAALFESQDPEVVKGIESLANLAEEAAEAVKRGDFGALAKVFKKNFALRRLLYGDDAVGVCVCERERGEKRERVREREREERETETERERERERERGCTSNTIPLRSAQHTSIASA